MPVVDEGNASLICSLIGVNNKYVYHFIDDKNPGTNYVVTHVCICKLLSFCLYECLPSMPSVREGGAKVMSVFFFFLLSPMSHCDLYFSSQLRFINMWCALLLAARALC